MFGRIFFLATEYVIVCFGFGDGEGESKDEGMGSLDPAKPLIVSTAPFVSIRFQLMGTFRGNTQKIIWSREKERKRKTWREREREKQKRRISFLGASFISHCVGHTEIATHKRLPREKRQKKQNTSKKFEKILC
jgi:hypothetical protein